jgi:hypothetical protein
MPNDYPEIQKKLERPKFEGEANLKTLGTDWMRSGTALVINHQVLVVHASTVRLISTDTPAGTLPPDEPEVDEEVDDQGNPLWLKDPAIVQSMKEKLGALDIEDSDVQEKIQPILSVIMPSKLQQGKKTTQQLCALLDQGGLPHMLDKAVFAALNEHGRVPTAWTKGLTRDVVIQRTENGFSVKALFEYRGSICKQSDPETPEFEQVTCPHKDKPPLICGCSEFSVVVEDGVLKPSLVKMSLTANCALNPDGSDNTLKLEAMLGRRNSKDATKSIKTSLSSISGSGAKQSESDKTGVSPS